MIAACVVFILTLIGCSKEIHQPIAVSDQASAIADTLKIVGENHSPYTNEQLIMMAANGISSANYIGNEPFLQEPSYESILTEEDFQMILRSCQEHNIPFSEDLLRENLPIGHRCTNTKQERYVNFMSALSSYRTEGDDIEAFVIRPGKTAVRDANYAVLATAYASFGDNYGPASAISYDYNRTGASDGKILSLDLALSNQAYNYSATDQLVEFEPDCINYDQAIEFSGHWFMITLSCPIYINGVEYGPFDWSNPLFYNPTITNEEFDACGQLITWTDGKVVGPIGGGISEIDVFGIIPMGTTFPCE